jgi:site-specific DNA-methyltransferase (adenine-specific)
MNDKTKVYNADCLPAMKEFPDKYFELAIVDPPYGIKISNSGTNGGSNKKHPAKVYPKKQWDNSTPDGSYFNELFRISKNQIVWGANHFGLQSTGWIVWDKLTTGNFSDCELAYTSFDGAVKKFTYMWNGFQQGPTKCTIEERTHPTQKPVALYKWLLKNYAKEGDKILDTHLGSQSSRIAAFDMGFDFTGYELDKDYFEAGNKRFNQHKAQLKLFS